MSLNKHERDVINALILRVNDLTWEVQRMQAQGHKIARAVPFKWLRRRMGFEMWPMLAEYTELRLFVDVAPVVELGNGERTNGTGNRRTATGKNSSSIPGYFERKPESAESLFVDSDDDTGS